MKKKVLGFAILALSLCLVACGAKEKKKEVVNKQLDSGIVKKDTTPAHQDIRLKFNDITLASAAAGFTGGTSLETLKQLFGEPGSYESVPAGDVSVDRYTWTFDQVVLRVHLYKNSSVVRSISNFRFNRDETVKKSDLATLKVTQGETPGTSFKDVSDKFGQPDVMSQSVSSENEEIEAVWTSGLKTEKGATLRLRFVNNALVNIEQTGLAD